MYLPAAFAPNPGIIRYGLANAPLDHSDAPESMTAWGRAPWESLVDEHRWLSPLYRAAVNGDAEKVSEWVSDHPTTYTYLAPDTEMSTWTAKISESIIDAEVLDLDSIKRACMDRWEECVGRYEKDVREARNAAELERIAEFLASLAQTAEDLHRAGHTGLSDRLSRFLDRDLGMPADRIADFAGEVA